METRRVTFVIATYKRADALKRTVGSLLMQEHQDWKAIVVGDCCGEETYRTLRGFGDPRIMYYNLPRRFGEQSGPNSFGLALADGDFLSFLNHDDLLLSDHLSYAVRQMEEDSSDFFIGKAANATEIEYRDGAAIPVFTETLPGEADLSRLMRHDPLLFDPSSFWLVRMPYARGVGPWRPFARLWRTPLQDWLLRAWRMGGRFSFGGRITGLRCWTHNLAAKKGGLSYEHATPEYDYMAERLRAEPADEFRRFVESQIEEVRRKRSAAESVAEKSPFMDFFTRKIMAAGYLGLGIDPVNLACRLRGRPRGKFFKKTLRDRTGEAYPEAWDLSLLLNEPEACRLI